MGDLYNEDYVTSTYGDGGLLRAFNRVRQLPPERSDNAGRVVHVCRFAEENLPGGHARRLLDVGSGIGVFPAGMRDAGWQCTAIDRDERLVRHAQDVVGVPAICGEVREMTGLGPFELVALNKVIEHVEDPAGLLASTSPFMASRGLLYVEVPDGEQAFGDSPEREEFFIDHLHVFTMASLCLTAAKAGLTVMQAERLREPSTKYTIRAFLRAGDAA